MDKWYYFEVNVESDKGEDGILKGYIFEASFGVLIYTINGGGVISPKSLSQLKNYWKDRLAIVRVL
jgi:hypothetical protein